MCGSSANTVRAHAEHRLLVKWSSDQSAPSWDIIHLSSSDPLILVYLALFSQQYPWKR